MSIDSKKILDDVKKIAEPKLKEIAGKLKGDFSVAFKAYMGKGDKAKFDAMMDEVADLQLKSLLTADPNVAAQYATAADRKMRSISVLLVAEKLVANDAIAKLIETAAVAVWNGFKDVAAGLVSVVVRGVLGGAFGSTGTMIADAAAKLVEKAVDSGKSEKPEQA